MARARDVIRDNAVRALVEAGTLAGDRVYTPRTWPTQPVDLPAIIVRTPTQRRQSTGRHGPPQFMGEVMLTVTARVTATTEADADEVVRVIAEQIETAILQNGEFIFDSDIQQFTSTALELRVSAEARSITAEAHCSFACEVYEIFEPTIDAEGDPFPPRHQLQGIDVKADLRNVFDPSGTYPAPTAPAYSPTPAPRSTGPDGRVEGGADIDLEQ